MHACKCEALVSGQSQLLIDARAAIAKAKEGA